MTSTNEHWGLEFSKDEIAGSLAKKGLLSLELELSRRCNLGCIYCYASSGAPQENELSLSEIKDIIDQAVALGAKKIIVLGGGEPFLYKELFTVIEYIHGKGVQVDLFTNGTMINEEKAQRLYDLDVSVSIKMNSQKREVQDYLAAKDGCYDDIQVGLAALRKVGYPDDNHVLGVETIICQQNYDELPDIWRWARDRDIIPYIEVMTMQGRALDYPGLEVSTVKVRELFELLLRIDVEEYRRPAWMPKPPLAGSKCARHEYSCTITSNGDIHPCPGVSVSAGNIREFSLAEIISSSKVITELRDIRNNIKGECATCEHGNFCYGCRGHAYQVTGDYLASDPLCWLLEDKAKALELMKDEK